jgi:hypothetical protein
MLRRLAQPDAPIDRMGFRLRGLEMTRLETLVDAAFAFSVTMLALSPDQIPSSFADMFDLFRGIPAFLFSLAMLLLFWNGHVALSRRYGLDDGPTTFLSIVFIAVMLVYVYPLKFMATAAFAYYVPPLRTANAIEDGTAPDLAAMFIAMSGGFVLLHAVIATLHVHALRKAGELGLTPHERKITRCEVGSATVYMGVGLASVALATLFRNSLWVVSAGFVYGALGVLMPLYWTRFGPTEAQIRAARGEGAAKS